MQSVRHLRGHLKLIRGGKLETQENNQPALQSDFLQKYGIWIAVGGLLLLVLGLEFQSRSKKGSRPKFD